MTYGKLKFLDLIYDDGGDQTLNSLNIFHSDTGGAPKTLTGTITSNAIWNQNLAFNLTHQYTDVKNTLATGGQIAVDASDGNYFSCEQAASTTISGFTWSNLPASGTLYMCTIKFKTNAQESAITWTPTVGGATKTLKWNDDTVPQHYANSTVLVSLLTEDAGTNWWGHWTFAIS